MSQISDVPPRWANVRSGPIPADVEMLDESARAGSGHYSALQSGSRICLRRLLSNAASGTKRRRKLVWRAFFPAA